MNFYQLDVVILKSSVHFSDKKISQLIWLLNLFNTRTSNLKKEDVFLHDFSYLIFFYMKTEELYIIRYLLPINLAAKFVQYMYSNRLFSHQKSIFFMLLAVMH